MSNADVIVLGAGMVGVSTALHLQKRGRSVVLVDRRGAGEETSYGNTGIIQREGVVPYPFPRSIGLMAQYALNMRTEANLHWTALPRIAPWLYRYWQASTPAGVAATARGARPLIERCVVEHQALMKDAGILGMMRRTGYLRLYRDAQALAAEIIKDEDWRKTYGIKFEVVDAHKLAELEPHLRGPSAGRGVDAGADERWRSRWRHQGLRPSAHGARRALPRGRCAHLGSVAQRLAGAHERRAGRGRSGGGGARTVVQRRAEGAGVQLSVRRQARLSHALQGRGQRHAQSPDHRHPARLCTDADGARASASPPVPSSPCAMRRRAPCS